MVEWWYGLSVIIWSLPLVTLWLSIWAANREVEHSSLSVCFWATLSILWLPLVSSVLPFAFIYLNLQNKVVTVAGGAATSNDPIGDILKTTRKGTIMAEKDSIVKSDRQKVWWRSIPSKGSWNWRMQNLVGLTHWSQLSKNCTLKRRPSGCSEGHHLEFFNTPPIRSFCSNHGGYSCAKKSALTVLRSLQRGYQG